MVRLQLESPESLIQPNSLIVGGLFSFSVQTSVTNALLNAISRKPMFHDLVIALESFVCQFVYLYSMHISFPYSYSRLIGSPSVLPQLVLAI